MKKYGEQIKLLIIFQVIKTVLAFVLDYRYLNWVTIFGILIFYIISEILKNKRMVYCYYCFLFYEFSGLSMIYLLSYKYEYTWEITTTIIIMIFSELRFKKLIKFMKKSSKGKKIEFFAFLSTILILKLIITSIVFTRILLLLLHFHLIGN